VTFTIERSLNRARAATRGAARSGRATLGVVSFGLAAGLTRSLTGLRWPKLDACTTRFREADGDRLLGGAGTVLAPADVMHLLSDEFAGLRGGRFALPLVSLDSFANRLARHWTTS
jgi:hypothetical protein